MADFPRIDDANDQLEHQTKVPDDGHGDLHLLDFLSLAAQHKWWLISLAFAGAVIALVLTYMVPQTFASSARILPPTRASSLGMLDQFNTEGSALKLLKSVENPSVDLLQNILESRTTAREIAADSAANYFYQKYVQPDDDFQEASDWVHTCVEIEPKLHVLWVHGFVSTGWFSTPKEREAAALLASRIPNLEIVYMNRFIVNELHVDSRDNRLSAEEEYNTRNAELDSLMAALALVQSQHRVVALPDQMLALIRASAEFRSELSETKIKEAMAGRLMTDDAPKVSELRDRAMLISDVLHGNDARNAIGPGFDSLPDVQRAMAQLEFQVEVLKPIVEFLRIEVEQARVAEMRDHAPITVLDSAEVPHRRAAPHRIPMIAVGGIVGAALVVVYLMILRIVRNILHDMKLRMEEAKYAMPNDGAPT